MTSSGTGTGVILWDTHAARDIDYHDGAIARGRERALGALLRSVDEGRRLAQSALAPAFRPSM